MAEKQTEMIERVAKAICESEGQVWADPSSGNGQSADEFYAGFREAAYAALKVMLEPEQRMLEDAGAVEGWGDDTAWCLNPDGVHREWWKAMILSALGEE